MSRAVRLICLMVAHAGKPQRIPDRLQAFHPTWVLTIQPNQNASPSFIDALSAHTITTHEIHQFHSCDLNDGLEQQKVLRDVIEGSVVKKTRMRSGLKRDTSQRTHGAAVHIEAAEYLIELGSRLGYFLIHGRKPVPDAIML